MQRLDDPAVLLERFCQPALACNGLNLLDHQRGRNPAKLQAVGERFLIGRRNRPVAALIGAGDLARLEQSSDAARQLAIALGQGEQVLTEIEAGQSHPAMGAFGFWRDELEVLPGPAAAVLDRSPSPLFQGTRCGMPHP